MKGFTAEFTLSSRFSVCIHLNFMQSQYKPFLLAIMKTARRGANVEKWKIHDNTPNYAGSLKELCNYKLNSISSLPTPRVPLFLPFRGSGALNKNCSVTAHTHIVKIPKRLAV